MKDIETMMRNVGQQATTAARQLARASSRQKNEALENIAELLLANKQQLYTQNLKDIEAGQEKGLQEALLDRLRLTEQRVEAMADGLRQIARLADPVGTISDLEYRPSGIQVGQMRVPLGVIGIVYESRPNVTADAAGLCIKSGNAVILRGGSESIHSNIAIARLISKALATAGLPEDCVQLVQTTDRSAVSELLKLDKYVDVIIPRGGKGLIERVSKESTIPVIKHLDGICHVYVHAKADHARAKAIAINAKVQRPGVCNAMETLLVDERLAKELLPSLVSDLQEYKVEIRGCERSCEIVSDIQVATEEDWVTEYLALILSIKVVSGLGEAIDHINTYGSHHTDVIVTEDYSVARRFLREVDSSSVMVNASPRFADGYEYGLGAEIGISTDKLHARGPVGLQGLTTLKYIVLGNGEVRG